MSRFEGLTVLITGATGGFGSVSARMFAQEGANLVLSDLPSADLEGFAAEFGARARTLAGDVADAKLHDELVALAASEFDGIDVAVNNAGISHARHRIEDIPEDKARQVIEVDLMGVWHALRAQIPAMDTRRGGRGGAIVNIASLAGIAGAPQIGIYSAAKHGVVGLTKTAAAENARRGIRVNAVCPAYARTPILRNGAIAALMADGKTEEEAEAFVARGVPMRRLGTAEEVAQAIVWCAAPDNGFMTGQAIAIDGGVTAV
ncbi:MAG: SDR family NAD(P)-dependent oxidoreductase [Pseudomonadota bacterium]